MNQTLETVSHPQSSYTRLMTTKDVGNVLPGKEKDYREYKTFKHYFCKEYAL